MSKNNDALIVEHLSGRLADSDGPIVALQQSRRKNWFETICRLSHPQVYISTNDGGQIMHRLKPTTDRQTNRTMGAFLLVGVSLLSLANVGRVRCFAIGDDMNVQGRRRRRSHTGSSIFNICSMVAKPSSALRRGRGIARDGETKPSRAMRNGWYDEWSLRAGAQDEFQDGDAHTNIHNASLQAIDSIDADFLLVPNLGMNVSESEQPLASLDVALATVAAKPGSWPCYDELDKELIRISLPVIGNYAISPLIGAVDLFWVNRMGNALAVAGQAAANQVFSSAFWFVSFLPSITATLVSKQHARGDPDATQDAICQALFVGFFIALVGTPIMFFYPDQALGSVLARGAPAMAYAKPYLLIRAFAFLPSLVSLVGFSAFRGILDTQTPVKVSAFANVFNAVLDPILIFAFAMGVPGAALATLAAEVISAAIYIGILRKRKLILWRKIVRPPSWKSLEPLLKGGLALQLRNLSLNLTFLAVARVTQSIDRSGVAAAAHAMAVQTFQIGGIVLLALSTVAQTVVPNAMVERFDEKTQTMVGGLEFAKATVNRLMSWGFVLGCALGSLQILLLPIIRRATPLQEVRDAAKIPAIIASVLQVINGLVFIGEGVMIGTGSFLQLSISTLAATVGCLWALWYFPPKVGLTGVWMGFGVFNVIRLIGVFIHQRINGPLSPRKIDEVTAKIHARQ